MIINKFGQPNIVKEDGTVIWSERNLFLTCIGSRDGADITLLDNNGSVARFEMVWKDRSGFRGENLVITNGKCVDCPLIGGGQKESETIYEIAPTDMLQPMFLRWKPSRYCGNGSLKIENNVLPCNGSNAGSKAIYVRNDGFDAHLRIEWNEDSNFDGGDLEIGNGSCINCPDMEGPAGKQEMYLIKPIEFSEPIALSWTDKSTCGTASLSVPSFALPCANSRNGAKISYLSNEGDEIRLQMDWDEGSGFTKDNLDIVNGECIDCPNMGGKFRREAVYVIKPTNLPEPVIVKWANTRFCGEGSLPLPTYILPCTNPTEDPKPVKDPSSAKPKSLVTFLRNDGFEAQLRVDWPEESTFMAENLVITNGECTNCPAIGGPYNKQATYLIRPTNLPNRSR